MRYYPIHLDLKGRRVAVVGAGIIALGKVNQLIEAGAMVTVIAPDVSPQLVKLAEAGSIDLVRRHFEVGDLTGSVLVIGATDSRTTNEEIAAVLIREEL